MYKYWSPIQLEEHRLFAKEVAAIWGVYSTSKGKENLHYKMVYAILEEAEYIERQRPLYYQTRSGLVRCFNQQTIQRGLHRLHTFSHEEPLHFVYQQNGHTFKYRLK